MSMMSVSLQDLCYSPCSPLCLCGHGHLAEKKHLSDFESGYPPGLIFYTPPSKQYMYLCTIMVMFYRCLSSNIFTLQTFTLVAHVCVSGQTAARISI